MKKYVLFLIAFSLIYWIFVVQNCEADDGDISQVEVISDVASWKLDTVKFTVFTKTCTVTYRKVDADGNYIDEFDILFRDVPEDEETPEIEFLDEFTQLIQFINNNSNIKQSISQAVMTKLNL